MERDEGNDGGNEGTTEKYGQEDLLNLDDG